MRALLTGAALASLVLGPAADAQFRSRAAPGRTVGLRVLIVAAGIGPELVNNGGFASTSGWLTDPGSDISNGTAGVFSGDGGTVFRNGDNVSVTPGRYRVSVDRVGTIPESAKISVRVPGSTTSALALIPAGTGGTYTAEFDATGSYSFGAQITGTDSGDGNVYRFDNYSIRKVS